MMSHFDLFYISYDKLCIKIIPKIYIEKKKLCERERVIFEISYKQLCTT
jgi:hypothetical protein